MREKNMRTWLLSLALVAAATLPVLEAAPAQAQATRTWVSGVGDDANPCSRTAPCKTFAGAISKTAANGEINCIDPGGFGAVTITKSMTINCETTLAGVLAPGTTGIVVNTAASDIVVLRGIELEGAGTGINGIRFLGAGVLHLHNVQIRNFRNGGNGINFAPSGAAELYVVDSFISGNGNSASTAGIQVRPSGSGSALLFVDGTAVENNSAGIIADGPAGAGAIRGVVRDSVVAGNTNDGLITTSAGPNVSLRLDNVTSAGNGSGLVTSGNNASLLVANSQVTANGRGLNFINGGVLLSYGNNRVNGNPNGEGSFSGSLAFK
jgi:hypothetical protein